MAFRAIAIPKRTERREHSLDLLGATLLAIGTSSFLLGLVFFVPAVTLIAERLEAKAYLHTGLTQQHVVDTMHDVTSQRVIAVAAASSSLCTRAVRAAMPFFTNGPAFQNNKAKMRIDAMLPNQAS